MFLQSKGGVIEESVREVQLNRGANENNVKDTNILCPKLFYQLDSRKVLSESSV